MTRVAVCGGAELAAAAETLGLVQAADPDLVLLDARSEEALTRAGAYAAEIPRVIVAAGAVAGLLRAAGSRHVAPAAAADVIGPHVAAAIPRATRQLTRRVVITAARGGVGRTLLATSLAQRLARTGPLWLLDATGTGAAAWWLQADARSWSELEPMTHELTIEHLRIVAVNPLPGLAVVGGPGPAPSVPLLEACLRELGRELVLIDAPLLADERTRELRTGSDLARRTLVLTYPDSASLAALDAHDLAGAWLIGSQGRPPGIDALRSLPRDDAAVAAALPARGRIGGKLGRAYDELAEILAIDAA